MNESAAKLPFIPALTTNASLPANVAELRGNSILNAQASLSADVLEWLKCLIHERIRLDLEKAIPSIPGLKDHKGNRINRWPPTPGHYLISTKYEPSECALGPILKSLGFSSLILPLKQFTRFDAQDPWGHFRISYYDTSIAHAPENASVFFSKFEHWRQEKLTAGAPVAVSLTDRDLQEVLQGEFRSYAQERYAAAKQVLAIQNRRKSDRNDANAQAVLRSVHLVGGYSELGIDKDEFDKLFPRPSRTNQWQAFVQKVTASGGDIQEAWARRRVVQSVYNAVRGERMSSQARLGLWL